MRTELSVDFMLEKPVSWLSGINEKDIALSSRIRLARNISGINFPINTSESERYQVVDAVANAVNDNDKFGESVIFDMEKLPETDRQFLFERHLISKDFCKGISGHSFILGKDDIPGIMVNEEDHIRLQVIRAGLCLQSIWQMIDEADNALSSRLPYAFNNALGFLTSCPTNVGTGMRASVMLNLTGLSLLGHINGVIQGASKLGLAVRGLYGEGSESYGNLFQVSNQSTLGESEIQIVQRVENIVNQIILHEKNAREILLQTKRNFMLDLIGRAYGTLCFSYILSLKEALNSISLLRVGVYLNMFSSLNLTKVNELFISVQDAHLQKYSRGHLDSSERDIIRADFVRGRLKH